MPLVVYPSTTTYPGPSTYPSLVGDPPSSASGGRRRVLPSITNATLTAVAGAGLSDDYDLGATGGSSKWSGEESVYFQRETERVERGGASDVIVGRSVVVSDELAVTWEIGDVLTVAPVGEGVQTLTVRRVAPTRAPGMAGVVRLAVEDG